MQVSGYKILISILLVAGLSIAGFHRQGPEPLHIDYPAYFGNRTFIPDDNPTTVEGVALGRRLFYEKRLSVSRQMSCGTCHRQELAFTDGKVFSEGADGSLQPRNTMSLVNLLWVRNFFWDGRVAGLEMQAAVPLTNAHEMGQSLAVSAALLSGEPVYRSLFSKAFGTDSMTGEGIVKALSQFERTLVSANAPYDQYLRGDYQPTVAELNGISLFYGNPDAARNVRGAGCAHCHGGPKTYIELYHNNGLDSIPANPGRELVSGQSYDRGRFRVVSLRNIALTAPYMHDGRFKTLEEVLSHYNEHIKLSKTLSPFLQGVGNSNALDGLTLGLTDSEKKDLLAFMHMLTDPTFISDKRFSDPFQD
ncbi:cytochrome-c peroxidase [Chitinophaga pinensis]|uniref:Cytochrome-c peroxidase n=1 Tax=Chitinophaga pinensis TaxID=79329 RepID=A0A5C6LSS5_9BACT|nr:cytochrome c peroxidase [Chitinophaga pinensis]TWV99667.1 cytochrome-c peroxidase [Chitinophaga pinensis]